MLSSKLSLVARNALRTPVRHSGHGFTYKGQNLPFDITNHRVLALKWTIFLAIPFGLPFYIVRYQLKKQSGA